MEAVKDKAALGIGLVNTAGIVGTVMWTKNKLSEIDAKFDELDTKIQATVDTFAGVANTPTSREFHNIRELTKGGKLGEMGREFGIIKNQQDDLHIEIQNLKNGQLELEEKVKDIDERLNVLVAALVNQMPDLEIEKKKKKKKVQIKEAVKENGKKSVLNGKAPVNGKKKSEKKVIQEEEDPVFG